MPVKFWGHVRRVLENPDILILKDPGKHDLLHSEDVWFPNPNGIFHCVQFQKSLFFGKEKYTNK